MSARVSVLASAFVSLAVALSVASCGGGGGRRAPAPEAREALAAPIVVPVEPASEVVDPGPGFDASAAYFADACVRRVFDPALALIERADALMRTLHGARTIELYDRQPYGALMAVGPARPGEDTRAATAPTGRSFARSAPLFEDWILDSRGQADGAHAIDAWIPRVDPLAGPLTVFAEARVYAEVDDARPFGVGSLTYAGAVDASTLGTPLYVGALEARGGGGAPATLELFEARGDLRAVPMPGERFDELQATAELDASGTPGETGRARIFHRERSDDGGGDSGIVATEWLLEYDADTLVRRRNTGSIEAFSRSGGTEHVWCYGLYDATGARVDLADGFGVRTLAGDVGWFGKDGLWMADDVALAAGETLERHVLGENEDVAYSVVTAPGKLVRLARHGLALAEIASEPFQWIVRDPTSGVTTLRRIAYDALVGFWVELAVFAPGTGEFVPHGLPKVVDVAGEGALVLFSEALGGLVTYVNGRGHVNWYDVEVVNGSDPAFAGGASLALYGFSDMLRTGLTRAEVEAGDVHAPDAPDADTPQRYVFDRDDLTLYHDPSGTGAPLVAVELPDAEAPRSGRYTWGLQTGALLTTPSVPGGTVASAWDEDVVYVWETGTNPWNRYLGLVDALGDAVAIEAPTRFLYEHHGEDDRAGNTANDGRWFVLELAPNVGLRGFPRVGVDLDGDGASDRWVPEVSLADGTLVGPSGAAYYVRALDLEVHLDADPAYAGALDLRRAGDLVVPDATSYDAPTLDAAPAVDAPRVVAGELVEP